MMNPSSGRERPSPFRKSEEERGERLKSGMSAKVENGSSPISESVTESGYFSKTTDINNSAASCSSLIN